MIVRVGHNHSVGVAHCNIMRMLKLSRFVAFDTKLGDKCSIALEHLDTVILLVAHVDETKSIRADSPRIVELTVS